MREQLDKFTCDTCGNVAHFNDWEAADWYQVVLPKMSSPSAMTFCSDPCHAIWAAKEAGGRFVPAKEE